MRVMANSTPSAAQADTMQHQRYVHKSDSPPSISVTSRPVSRLKRSMAPMVWRQGYSFPLIVIFSILRIKS